jgi:hypothetical protein
MTAGIVVGMVGAIAALAVVAWFVLGQRPHREQAGRPAG